MVAFVVYIIVSSLVVGIVEDIDSHVSNWFQSRLGIIARSISIKRIQWVTLLLGLLYFMYLGYFHISFVLWSVLFLKSFTLGYMVMILGWFHPWVFILLIPLFIYKVEIGKLLNLMIVGILLALALMLRAQIQLQATLQLAVCVGIMLVELAFREENRRLHVLRSRVAYSKLYQKYWSLRYLVDSLKYLLAGMFMMVFLMKDYRFLYLSALLLFLLYQQDRLLSKGVFMIRTVYDVPILDMGVELMMFTLAFGIYLLRLMGEVVAVSPLFLNVMIISQLCMSLFFIWRWWNMMKP